jgi:hypothetical protein
VFEGVALAVRIVGRFAESASGRACAALEVGLQHGAPSGGLSAGEKRAATLRDREPAGSGAGRRATGALEGERRRRAACRAVHPGRGVRS